MDKIIEGFTWLGLSEFEATALCKLLFASICGAFIGFERQVKGRPAGFKTFSLVCVGSTLAMITNEFIYIHLADVSGDPARMAAQVISGIGFLGAGTIIVTGNSRVKGLTTAAALWVTAAIGITIGAGFYFGGVAGMLVIVASSMVYHFIEQIISARSRFMRFYIEGANEELMLSLMELFAARGIKVLSLQRKGENKWLKKDTCAIMEVDLGKKEKHKDVLKQIEILPGFRYVEEV